MNKIKELFYEKPLYKKFRFWRFRSFPPKSTPQYWIKKYLKNIPLWVVQVGANDGLENDPLNAAIMSNNKWQCLFVEPVPYIFQKLKSNYGENKRFHFEQSAVNDGSEQSFYYVSKDAHTKEKSIPYWFEQLGSFNKSNIAAHVPGLEQYIEEIKVKGVTLPGLFEKYNVTDLQVLLIDAEGYDFEILSQLDLDKFLPLIILFEHSNLEAQKKQLSKKMLSDKYFLFELGINFLCIEKTRFNKYDFKYLKPC